MSQAARITRARFDLIHDGMTKAEVLKILGPPDVSVLARFCLIGGKMPTNERERMQRVKAHNAAIERASWAHWQCRIDIIFTPPAPLDRNTFVTYMWGDGDRPDPSELADDDTLVVMECEYSDEWRTAVPLKDRRRLVHRFPTLEQ
jgi:hypothetical protein